MNYTPLDKELFNKRLDEIERETDDSEGKNSGTETPTSYTFEDVKTIVEQYLPNMTTPLKLVLAIATSGTRANRVMLWLMLVDSPSGGKTDLANLITDCKKVVSIDSLTQNSFISGERENKSNKVYDLLNQLDKKCLLIKEWTVIFSADERATKKIIGDMVGIYDKKFSKFSPRRSNITYTTQFSHIGCITPATLNKHHNYLNMIGARFLHYMFPELSRDNETKGFDAIFSNEDRDVLEKKARQIVSNYLDQLNKDQSDLNKPLSLPVKEYLTVCSQFLARARGIVVIRQETFTNEEGNKITFYQADSVQIEKPFRAVQQLLVLARYLAFVVGNLEVGIDECEIIRDIVLSSMPADRAKALRALKECLIGELTAKELDTNQSNKTSRRLLDELVFLGVVKKDQGTGQMANRYSIVPEYFDFVRLSAGEFMSNYSNSSKKEQNEHSETTVQQIQSPIQTKIDDVPLREKVKGLSIVENNILVEKEWQKIEEEFGNKEIGKE